MSSRIPKFLLGLAFIGMLFGGTARAADLPQESFQAAPPPTLGSFYIAVRGGLNFLEDNDFGVLGTTVETDYDVGYGLFGAIGYDTGDIWTLGKFRLEGEIGFRHNDVDSHNVGGVNVTGGAADGDVYQYSFMANLYHDFLPGATFRPYVGFGLGYAEADADGFAANGVTVLNDSDGDFAYQLMAGASWQFAPQWTLEAEYRYFATDSISLQAVDGTTSTVDFDNHSALVGLRFGF